MALEGIYPIIIDGELAGKLTVAAQGARMVFDAVCRPIPGVVRISVYGGGTEGALGVLAPDGTQFGLHKILSRTDLKAFPQEIESVERSGLDRRAQAAAQSDMPAAAEKTEDTEQLEKTAEAEQPEDMMPEETPEAEMEEMPRETPPAAAEEETPPGDGENTVPEGADGLSWYSSPDGALVCFDGRRSLIALPIGDARIPAGFGGERRSVEGKEYMVYITKNGRIVT